MAEFGGTYLTTSTEIIPKCPVCFTSSHVVLVDFFTQIDKPYIAPIWWCKTSNYIFSARTKTMENLANGHSVAEKRNYVKKYEEMPIIYDPAKKKIDNLKIINNLKIYESNGIQELERDIRDFKLK